MADVDPQLWAEASEEARSTLRRSFWGGLQRNLSDAYQNDYADQTEYNLTVKIYNRKVEEHNRRVRGY